MQFSANDFMTFLGTTSTLKQTARKSAPARPRNTNVATMTAPRPVFAPAPVADGQATKPVTVPPPAAAPPAVSGLELVMYSDRSFAIFGDTKPHKDQLSALFGKFNRYLKRDGVATPGYIFSIGRLDAVRKAMNL